MTTRIAELGEDGKLHPDVMPDGFGGGGGTGVGGPQVWEWHFPGSLQPRTGLVKRSMPWSFLNPGYGIKPIMIMAILGTIGSLDTRDFPPVKVRFAVNGVERGVLTFQQNTSETAWLGTTTIPALNDTVLEQGDVVSFDILAAPTSGTVRPGDLTLSLWWEWHAL